MAAALASGRDTAAADYQFHLGIARATQNPHFADLMATLGAQVIPRARLAVSGAQAAEPLEYLRRVQVEHETVFDAIAAQDADAARAAMRTHLANSRERRRKLAARLGNGSPLV
jgi:DNA-binding FadR family transcriptional regulator